MNRHSYLQIRTVHVLSVIVMFAISAGILLVAQSGGCIGASLAGTDGSYDTPDAVLFGHAPVQAVTTWEGMTNLSVVCQIADTFADTFFTGVLDVAYAVHAVLSLTAVDNITDDSSLGLDGAYGITTFKLGSHTYAAVTSNGDDDGVQVLDITNPSNITAAGSQIDPGSSGFGGARGITAFVSDTSTYVAFTAHGGDSVHILSPDGVTDPFHIIGIPDEGTRVLDGASDIATFASGSFLYAAVAAFDDDGVQILNITQPERSTLAGNITDDGTNDDDLELNGAYGIVAFESKDHTYAAVTAYEDDGVQILDITNPFNIIPASRITDTNILYLNGTQGIATFKSGNHTYIAVAAFYDDGVQILNITDPSNITPAGSIADDGTNADDLELNGARDITTFVSGNHTYAAVVAYEDDGVQLLDITNPSNIIAAGSIDTNTLELDGASGITTFESGGHIYAAVAANEDNGVQILRIDILEPDTTSSTDAFVTTWRTTSDDQEITINFVGSGMDISWGDGTTVTGVSVPQTHTYTDAGDYTVSVTGGLTGLTLDRPPNSIGLLGPVPELASIDQWGGISWTNMNNAFAGASNMVYMATDTPDLRLVTDMSGMFASATAFDGDLSSWDVSSVTHMTGMFLDATTFDGDLSSWDVSSVTHMSDMFNFASSFDQPINDWDVSSVSRMNNMFYAATSFNQPLNDWDVSSVTDMYRIFAAASSFNQLLNAWDVSSVTDMSDMFYYATTFDGDISAWDVSSVTDMNDMFYYATSFNRSLNDWDVSSVTDTDSMFYYATDFDGDISAWDVSSVTDMNDMFLNASSFNQALNAWDVSSVTDMKDMFLNATAFDQDLSGWYVVQDTPVLTANAMFSIRAQNSYLDGLVSTYSVDDTRFVMDDKTLSLNSTNLPPAGIYPLDITAPAVLGEPDAGDEGHTRTLIVTVKGEHLPFITTWRTTLPSQEITINFVGSGMNISWGDGMTETNVSGTQSHTYATAGDYRVSVTGALTGLTLDRPDVFGNLVGLVPELASIDQWGGISWTNMSNAFAGASNMTYTATDTPDLRLVTDMHRMFETATAFDGDLSSWDVSSVTDMAYMFSSATSFNQPLNAWDVSSVTDMTYMFGSATSFNRPLNDWDVSSVTDMFGMFFAASSFDRPLNDWDVSSVRGMRGMFFNAISFDQPLHAWDVSSVSIMHSMFSAAILFDRPLNAWDVSSVTDMYGMFHDTYSFNQPLHAWDVSKVADMSTMFKSARDFNHPLNDWDVSSVTHMAEMFEGASSFNKDLSSWYITPESAVLITDHSRTLTVMPLSPYIGEQSPVYTVNDARFVMNGRTLSLNSANTPTADIYDLDITATAVLDEPNTSTHTRTVAITVRDPSTVPFITTWRTDSADQTITVPVGGSTARYSIDWGDNSLVETDITGDSTHTYREAGIHTVSISGNFERIHLDGQQPNAGRLVSIEQWGDMYWTSMSGAFDGAYNMVYDATAAPDLGLVSDTSRMFAGAAAFDGNISGWNVSAVRDMSGMFDGATSFDQSLNDWDVLTVRDMSGMFDGAAAFDGDISGWGVSAVRDMSGMFDGATSFDQHLKDWDVLAVRDMSGMFDGATSFDQPLNSWNVSSVRDMSSIFDGATLFDRPLDDWDVSSTTDMTRMFAGATSFNRPLDDWDISAATGMSGMFAGATAFDQDLSGWYVTLDGPAVIALDHPRTPKVLPLSPYLDGHLNTYSVNDPQFVVAGRTLLLADPDSPPTAGDYLLTITTAAILGEPNTGSHTGTFEITVKDPTVRPFITTWNTDSDNQTITIPGTGRACNIDWGDGTVHLDTYCRRTHTYAEAGTHTVLISGGLERFHLDGQQPNAGRLASIEQWGDIYWTSMRSAFEGASNMVYNATDAPDLSRVSDTSSMFEDATSFDGDLASWDVSAVTNMNSMFEGTTSFDQPLNDWDVSSVTDMRGMFRGTTSFDRPLNDWNVSSVINMEDMFSGATKFNQLLNDWNVSSVTDMSFMLSGATDFNQPLNDWDVSSVTDMFGMFAAASSFNQLLNDWDVSSVTDMNSMFGSATDFNQPLNTWNVSSVTGMSGMFYYASSFDQSLNTWNVSSVIDMYSMFGSATDFNQPLNDWDVSSVDDMSRMFESATSFDQPLNAWDVSSVTDMPYMFYGATSFDQPLNDWDVSSVSEMGSMFYGATDFNRPLNAWDVSYATYMNDMFRNATSFNQPLASWDVSSVTGMSYMFKDATSFDHPLASWDVSSVTGMYEMFKDATAFDQDLAYWYVVPDPVRILTANATFSIRAQNGYLDDRSVYSVSDTRFVINDKTLSLNSTHPPPAGTHSLTISATAVLDEPASHTRTIAVTVKGEHRPFITTWRTATASQNITINFVGSGLNISWGDGMTETNVKGSQTHTYATAGNYTVSVTGALTGLTLDTPLDLLGNPGPVPEIVSIDQWGDISWTTMRDAFEGASNMTYRATDVPDMSRVLDMSNMFKGATSFDGDISSWGVSSVTDTSYMFSGATSFNGDLSSWDVSSVTDMEGMFSGVTSFNQPLSSWDVSRVTNMRYMFFSATSFDRPLVSWDVSRVTDMANMFFNTDSFNQPLASWDVSRVTDMANMFGTTDSFNQPLASWDVSRVTDMNSMFSRTDSFNGDISSWDVSRVTDMNAMFSRTDSFNGDISSWDVSRVTDMDRMFRDAASFNGDISSWDVSSVTRMEIMFKDAASFNGDISSWDVSNVNRMERMFDGATSFDQNLGEWYATLDGTVLISDGSRNLAVSPLSPYLDGLSPAYSLNDTRFAINGRTLSLDPGTSPPAGDYPLAISATALLGEPGSHSRTFTVTVSDSPVRDLPVRPFVTTWNTDSANQAITIPVGGSTAPYHVDWGDNTASTGVTGDSTHTYAEAGNHTVSISGGFERIHLNDRQPNADRLVSIDQWGDVSWTSMREAFAGASNMVYNATDAPDLGRVSDMSDMFGDAASFDGDISSWDVSAVTDMSNMFAGASSFNQPLSSWDLSSVTYMGSMFNIASSFNQDISSWDVSRVIDMNLMFASTPSFNGNISSWDVSSVRDMRYMFYDATVFNANISSWDVSRVTDMEGMFYIASSFDGDISSWDVSAVTNMNRMFHSASSFNGDISSWDVSAATDMNSMFTGASSFAQNLGKWYAVLEGPDIIHGSPRMPSVSPLSPYLDGRLTVYLLNDTRFIMDGRTLLANPDELPPAGDYYLAISTASLLAEPNADSHSRTFTVTVMNFPVTPFITTWNTGSANQTITIPGTGQGHTCNIDWGDGTVHVDTSCRQTHTYAEAGTHTVSISGGLERFHLDDQRPNADRLASIEQWGDIRWTSMREAFEGASNMVYNATDAPNLSRVSDMSSMFEVALSFNGNLSSWDVSSVTDMSSMFSYAYDFNGDLSSWDVSAVTDMSIMFNYAYKFNGDLSSWDVSAVTDMSHMFEAADSFNGDLSSWDVSAVTDMSGMFTDAISFNGNLSGWNVSKVTNMGSMFLSAELFNQSLNNWNVSAVTSMNRMFHSASSFNQTISSWDVSAVTDMHRMFYRASDFNQPLNGWDVSKVTDMSGMFYQASDFNQPLNAWNVSKVTSMASMFFAATSFSQNLGNWYVTLDSTEIDLDGDGRVVGAISAQNGVLDRQSPTYDIGEGADSDLFMVNSTDKTLELAPNASPLSGVYKANITSTGPFGTDNHRVLDITVRGSTNSPPVVLAGDDQVIGEGNTVTLSGSATDTDGDDITYTWSQTAPTPPSITFVNASASSTTFTAPSVTGDTPFTLTLTADDGTQSAEGTLVITVKETGTAFITTWNTISADQNITINFVGSGMNITWGDGAAETGVNGSQTHTYAKTGNHPVSVTGGLTGLTLHQTEDVDGTPYALELASIDQWGDISWTTMSNAFAGASNMVYRATVAPDLSGVASMSGMFSQASSFNGDLSGWNVSSVTDMSNMFFIASSFNGTLSDWNVSSVNDMNGMFWQASSFDRPLNDWNVSSVSNMNNMFLDARAFNKPLNDWNVSSVTEMDRMFADAASFDQPLNDWNVSSVTVMSNMFNTASSFNGTLSDWNVSSVTDMSGMFSRATAFNGIISDWDVSSVTDMTSMFNRASSFDRPLNTWNVSSVTNMNNMSNMFNGATAFDQNLGMWYVVPDSVSIASSDVPGVVGTISAQNTALNEHNPVYGIGMGMGGDSDRFGITDGNKLNMTSVATQSTYTVNVTASGPSVFENGSNWHILKVNVTGLNNLPDAEAGPDLSVDEGGSIALQGSGSDDDDGDQLTYSWSEHNLLTFDNRTSATPTVTASSVTTNMNITLTLTVSDGIDSDADTMVLTVRNVTSDNLRPTINVGPDQTVKEGAQVSVPWTATNPDGDPLTYSWSQDPLLPAISLNSPGLSPTTFTAPAVDDDTDFTFTLTVTAGPHTVEDSLTVTVRNNHPPVAEAGPNLQVDEGGSVVLQGSGSDVDAGDELTYLWSEHDLLTFENRTFATPKVTASSVTANVNITLTLTVDDGTASETDTMVLTVQNLNDTRIVNAEAGPDLSVDEGGSVVLQGSGSDDDAGDELTYLWSEHDLLTFENRTFAAPTVTASSVTNNTRITLTLIVSDGTTSDEDMMVLTIRDVTSENFPPSVRVGPNQTVREGAQVSMPWTATDPDGDAMAYSWSQIPLLPAISLDSPDLSPTTFTAPAVDANTDFTFTLTVITGTHTVEDSLTVTVRNDHLPSVDAGPDKTVDEGTTVTLTGSASDPDKDPLTYVWERISGSQVTLTDGNTLRPQFAAPRVTSDEQIVFRLNVTDDAGKSAEDTVTVTVRDVPIAVSSATYNPGNGQLTITFNQDIGSSDPDYSAMHIRSTGSDSGGIALSDIADRSHSGRTVTATLDSGQQDTYDNLESAQLDIAGGAVTDADGVPIIQMLDIPISDVSRKKSSSSKAPIVHINALVQARIVDIPPHIAEQVALHDASDPLEPVMPDDTFDLPLVIDGRGYLLDDLINTLVLQTVTTGDGPAIITFTVYTQKDLAHFALYLNLKDENTDYADSDTRITYKDDGTTVVTDPHGYIGDNSTITVTQEDDQVPEKKTVRITVEFEEPIGPTNMVAYMWNTDRKATFVRIIDAFEVAASAVLQEPVMQKADPEPVLPDSEMPADPEPVVPYSELPADPEPVPRDTPWPDDYDDDAQVLTLIRMWSGFEPESITDAQLIDLLGLEDYRGADIPDWMMTELGVLVVRDAVTVNEFMLALQYVLEHA